MASWAGAAAGPHEADLHRRPRGGAPRRLASTGCPAAFREAGPDDRRGGPGRGARGHPARAHLAVRGPALPADRPQRRGRSRSQRVRSRAQPLRRDPARLLRPEGPRRRHGRRRRRPRSSASRRSPSSPATSSSRPRTRSSRAACVAGVQRLHPRRVVRRRARIGSIPLVILPLWDATLAAAEVERVAAKGARGDLLPREPVTAGPAVVPHRPLGSAVRRRGGRRHAAVPALRLVGPAADGRARRPVRRSASPCSAQLDVRDRRPAVLAGVPPLPAAEGRAVRGRHRLGAVHARAHRLHVGAAPVLHRRRPRHPAVRPVPPAHLGLLHRRRARPRRTATTSASTASPSSPTTRTRTRTGRTAGSVPPRCSPTSPTTRSTASSS